MPVGSTKPSIFTSKSILYLCLLILALNQCLAAHSLRIIATDFDQVKNFQNSVEDNIRELYPRWEFKPMYSSDEYPLEENNYSVVVEPTIQRRFCCMSPVGGRKRSIRSLSREQQRQQSSNRGQKQ